MTLKKILNFLIENVMIIIFIALIIYIIKKLDGANSWFDEEASLAIDGSFADCSNPNARAFCKDGKPLRCSAIEQLSNEDVSSIMKASIGADRFIVIGCSRF